MSKTLRSPQHIRLLKLLLDLRNSKRMTQIDLAIQLGRPQSFVSKYETGERQLNVIELCDVVCALGADPVTFLANFLQSVDDEELHEAKIKPHKKRK
jgi:transcriptional regulator with XRE-family HTH domain